MRPTSASLVRTTVSLLVCASVAGCPVEGKRKKRVERDAGTGKGLVAKACACPPLSRDAGELAEVTAELAAGDPVTGGTLRIHAEVDPPSLNPVLRPDAWIVRIALHDVLETLVVREAGTGRFEGQLARSWTTNEDGTLWTFELKKDVRWHDGKPFGPRDVIHTLDMVMAPDSTAVSVKASLEEIAHWEARGEDEVVLTLSRPSSLFLQHLEGLPILPRHLYVESGITDHPANRAPVGTGPFRFSAWIEGKEIVLARNDGYHGRKALLDEVRYVIVKDRNVAFQMLRRGDIDLMPRINVDQLAEYENDASLKKRFWRLTYPTADISFLMYNQDNPLFASEKVRQAMTMLLDRDRIRCSVHGCLARVISGPFPLGHPANDPEVKPWPYDPAAADRLLASQGFEDTDGDTVLDRDGRPFRFTFIIPTQSDSIQRMGTIYQEELASHGIAMDIKLLDWSTYIERCRAHDFDMGAMSYQMEWDNDLTGIFHSRSIDGGQNFISMKDDGVDYILDRVRRSMDEDERNALLRDLHDILHRQQPYTFCFSPMETTLVSRSFGGPGLVPSLRWFQESAVFAR